MEYVNLKINGIEVQAPKGSTILEAARIAGITIPTLCYLKEINEIIDRYSENVEKLPGLVAEKETDEEDYNGKYEPTPGIFSFEVYKYCGKNIYFRFLNGTNEDMTYLNDYHIFEGDNEIKVINSNYQYEQSIVSGSYDEDHVELVELLPAGTYRLVAGEYVAQFEIR